MPTEVRFSPTFKKDLKRLAKKYPHIKSDMQEFLTSLQAGLLIGDQIPDLGYQVYKERIKNSDAQKGKSGGYRVIYYVVTDQARILLTIYSKSDQPDIYAHQIRAIIEAESSEETKPQEDTEN